MNMEGIGGKRREERKREERRESIRVREEKMEKDNHEHTGRKQQ
jgi:hypothetical protein